MKKIIKLRCSQQQKIAVNKASGVSSAKQMKHQRKNSKKSSGTSRTEDSKSNSSVNETLPFDLLLAAGKVLAETKKNPMENDQVDPAIPLFRAIAPLNHSNSGLRNKVCHVIPNEDDDEPRTKLGASSAEDKVILNRALHNAISILDVTRASSLPQGVHFEGHTRVDASLKNDAYAIPKCCRPIPPPPRLPRVPIGYAYPAGNLPAILPIRRSFASSHHPTSTFTTLSSSPRR